MFDVERYETLRGHLEVVNRLRHVFSDPEKFNSWSPARDGWGRKVEPTNPDAEKFCILGLVIHEAYNSYCDTLKSVRKAESLYDRETAADEYLTELFPGKKDGLKQFSEGKGIYHEPLCTLWIALNDDVGREAVLEALQMCKLNVLAEMESLLYEVPIRQCTTTVAWEMDFMAKQLEATDQHAAAQYFARRAEYIRKEISKRSVYEAQYILKRVLSTIKNPETRTTRVPARDINDEPVDYRNLRAVKFCASGIAVRAMYEYATLQAELGYANEVYHCAVEKMVAHFPGGVKEFIKEANVEDKPSFYANSAIVILNDDHQWHRILYLLSKALHNTNKVLAEIEERS